MKSAVASGDRQAAKVAEAAFNGLSRDQVLDAYRTIVLSRKIDDKEIQLKNQSHAFFQISGAGHEAILVAVGMTLRAGYDWFHPYYRDRALCLQLGVTALDMFLASVGADADPSNAGRQMPSHWGNKSLNIVAGSSCTATQVLHAVGMAEAGTLYSRIEQIANRETLFHADEIVYTSLGEGSTSEGEFWEAVSVSCTRHIPVLFLVEDNGYAISTPVEVEMPGGDISKLLRSFPGLHIETADGTDLFDSLRAVRAAADYVRARKGPALVHAHVIRPYSHSLSDDEKLYKTAAEREAEAKRDPIGRLATFITTNGLATAADLATLEAELDREVSLAAEQAVAAPKPSKNFTSRWARGGWWDAKFCSLFIRARAPPTTISSICHKRGCARRKKQAAPSRSGA